MSSSSSVLLLAAIVCLLPFTVATRTVYRSEDITPITLYGPSAVYLPQSCPQSIVFTGRARHLPELADDKIGILPRDIVVDGKRCKADAVMIDFAPLGPTDHYPPQWVFEDSRFHGHPVNFTCGDKSLSIRFGYFNDVSTKETGGLLRPEVMYFDFAVIPNTRPFAFCSYAGRRGDGKRPLDFAPFPSQKTWKKYHELRKLTHPTPKINNDVQVSPMPEESMEAEVPTDGTHETEGHDETDETGKDIGIDIDENGLLTITENGPTTGDGNTAPTMAPWGARIAHEDPFHSSR